MALPVHAEPASAVVLLRMPRGAQRGTEDRTRDELRLMGIRVDEVSDPRNDTRIEQIITEHGALAAIRLEAAGETYGAVAWFHDGSDGGEVTAQRFSGLPSESALVALRMAETVRHRVIELQSVSERLDPVGEPGLGPMDDLPVAEAELLPPPPVFAEPVSGPEPHDADTQAPEPTWRTTSDELDVSAPPAAAVQTQTRPKAARALSLGIASAVAGGPGGAHSLLGASMTLGWRVVSILTLQAEFGALASPASVSGSRGSVQLGLASAQILCALGLPGERRVMPQLRIGAGPALAWATGRGSRRADGGTDLGVTAIVTGGVGLAIRVRPRLRLSIGVDILLSTRAVGVRVDGAEEIRLGPPVVRGMLGFAWILPSRGRQKT